MEKEKADAKLNFLAGSRQITGDEITWNTSKELNNQTTQMITNTDDIEISRTQNTFLSKEKTVVPTDTRTESSEFHIPKQSKSCDKRRKSVSTENENSDQYANKIPPSSYKESPGNKPPLNCAKPTVRRSKTGKIELVQPGKTRNTSGDNNNTVQDLADATTCTTDSNIHANMNQKKRSLSAEMTNSYSKSGIQPSISTIAESQNYNYIKSDTCTDNTFVKLDINNRKENCLNDKKDMSVLCTYEKSNDSPFERDFSKDDCKVNLIKADFESKAVIQKNDISEQNSPQKENLKIGSSEVIVTEKNVTKNQNTNYESVENRNDFTRKLRVPSNVAALQLHSSVSSMVDHNINYNHYENNSNVETPYNRKIETDNDEKLSASNELNLVECSETVERKVYPQFSVGIVENVKGNLEINIPPSTKTENMFDGTLHDISINNNQQLPEDTNKTFSLQENTNIKEGIKISQESITETNKELRNEEEITPNQKFHIRPKNREGPCGQSSAVNLQVDRPKNVSVGDNNTTVMGDISTVTVVGDGATVNINVHSRNWKCEERLDMPACLSIWNCDQDFLQNCTDYLVKILIYCKSFYEKTTHFPDPKHGIEKGLDTFLKKLLIQRDTIDENIPLVRHHLQELVQIINPLHCPTITEIKSWLDLSNSIRFPSILTNNEVESVKEFLKTSHLLLDDIEINEFRLQNSDRKGIHDACSHTNIDKTTRSTVQKTDIDDYITSEVALALCRLLSILTDGSDRFQHCFLTAILTPLEFNQTENFFDRAITFDKFRDFVITSKLELDKYEHYLQKDSLSIQAYLIQLSIIKTKHIQSQSDREQTFCKSVIILDKLETRINEMVSLYATKSPFNFEKLLYFCQKIMEGDIECCDDKLPDFETIFCQKICASEKKKVVNPKECKDHGIVDEILLAFDFKKYFPKKLTLQHICLAKCNSEIESKSDVLWNILERLVMTDYKAREYILEQFYKSPSKCISEGGNWEEFLSDIGSGTEQISDSVSETQSQYHPLDVFIVLFACCDNQLKQALVRKMFLCKQAIPLIYPCLTDESLYFSMWSMRSINVERQESEVSLVKCPLKTVVFMRINRPKFSKSKLLNVILRDQSHDTFFHWDCPLGNTTKILADGLVEASWLIPKSLSEEVIMFMNLRGNAIRHEKQTGVLSAIANIIILVITFSELRYSDCRNFFNRLYEHKATVILIVTDDPKSKNLHETSSEFRQSLKTQGCLDNTKFFSIIRQGEFKTSDEIKKSVLEIVLNILASKESIMIENMVPLTDVVNEETEKECSSGKDLATEVLKDIYKFKSPEIKKEMLPLQQPSLWGEWERNLRSLRIGQFTLKQNTEVIQTLNNLRDQQFDICCNLKPHMIILLQTLSEIFHDQEKVIYFFSWMKIILDDYTLGILPNLNKERRLCRNMLKYAKNSQNRSTEKTEITDFKTSEDTMENISKILNKSLATGLDLNDVLGNIEALEETLNLADQNLIDSSFGLEHFLREIGQIYEAIKDGSQTVKRETAESIEILPRAVAKLILLGHPLEIMDGDNAAVPVTWIKAVLKNLEILTDNCKVLTISVIGIQSSGKSTLLNTMFGLQFPVGAGRCTRGIFMQLVPTGKESACGTYDYILVLDTEGLTSTGRETNMCEHDNILATLAIGLCDITLVNIKGENTAEVEDFLEIVVHASFRLKLVNPNLNFQKTCLFLHQNVSAVNAPEKMQDDRAELEDRLDAATRKAAEYEGTTIIDTFKRVINFDSQKHCFYFSDYWTGDPPMAPVNPGYSVKVRMVKNIILTEFSVKKEYSSLQKFVEQIEDLWKGILSDNFVFVFKHSLDIRAYKSIDRKYQELLCDLETYILDEKKIAEMQLAVPFSENIKLLIESFEKRIDEKFDEAKSELTEFIDNHELIDFLIHRKDCLIDDLCRAKVTKVEIVKQKLLEFSDLETDGVFDKQMTFRKQIYAEAENYAKRMIYSPTDSRKLKEEFDGVLITWINAHRPKYLPKADEISNIVIDKIYERFSTEKHVLQKYLKIQPFSSTLNTERLEGSLKVEEVSKFIRPCIFSRLKHIFQINSRLHLCKRQALRITNCIFRKIEKYLNSISDNNFDESHVSQLIRMIVDEIESKGSSSEHQDFTFSSPYKIYLSIHVCRYALPKFVKMSPCCKERNSGYLDLNFKDNMYRFFQNVVAQKKEEYIAAELLCDSLQIKIIEKVTENIQREIVKEVLFQYSDSKQNLLADILIYLLDSHFRKFESYLVDPNEFASRWIYKHVKKLYFFGQNHKFGVFSEKFTGIIIQQLNKRIYNVTASIKLDLQGLPFRQWMEKFLHINDIIALSEIDVAQVIERNVKDMKGFENILVNRLRERKQLVLKKLKSTRIEQIVWPTESPYQNIMEKLWGCLEACPFCGEPCDLKEKDHISKGKPHTCSSHRPVMNGSILTKKMPNEALTYVCNSFVDAEHYYFSCEEVQFECRTSGICKTTCKMSSIHYYKDYKLFFPHWNIPPASKQKPILIWRKLLAQFSFQLKGTWKNFPKIPEEWNKIKPKDAKDSLRLTGIYRETSL